MTNGVQHAKSQSGAAREVSLGKRNPRSFWAPTFEIVGWTDRQQIPVLKYRPPTVDQPIQQHLQIPFLKPGGKKPRGKTQPAVSNVLDDEIPF
jgi:hypothetical protein